MTRGARSYLESMTTEQAPIHSGFGARSTAQEVIAGHDLTGSIAIVTGGHGGIGLETTRALAGAGATVLVGSRDVARAREALEGIPRVEIDRLDLFAPASVDAFAARFLATQRPLHRLIDNAGIMAVPLVRDARGYESQVATNHFGHFQLTARLWPALVRANGARVVVLTSRGHVRGAFDFDDPFFVARAYDKWNAYGRSKTANALFALALDARGAKQGVRAFSVHPGAVMTDLARAVSSEELAKLRPADWRSSYKTPAQGAATSVWCATSAQLDEKGGVYCEDVDVSVAVPGDFEGTTGVRPWARDPAIAERLWWETERWSGVRFSVG